MWNSFLSRPAWQRTFNKQKRRGVSHCFLTYLTLNIINALFFLQADKLLRALKAHLNPEIRKENKNQVSNVLYQLLASKMLCLVKKQLILNSWDLRCNRWCKGSYSKAQYWEVEPAQATRVIGQILNLAQNKTKQEQRKIYIYYYMMLSASVIGPGTELSHHCYKWWKCHVIYWIKISLDKCKSTCMSWHMPPGTEVEVQYQPKLL